VPTGTPVRAPAPHPANPAAGQWTAVGPAAVVRGAAAGRPRVAGRVRALAVSPDGQRAYAGAAGGGVWYSGDGGAHWTALDFYASTLDGAGALHPADALTVGALAVRWGATAAADVVYVGPGERPPRAGAPAGTVQGVGIRVATGPAAAAAATGAAAADPWRLEATDLRGVAVHALAPDRVAAGVAWAATSRGLYRRPAAGAGPWTKVDPGLGKGEIADVVVVPGLGTEPERVYAASATGALARSADGGAHWVAVPLPAFPAAEVAAGIPVTRMRLAAGNVPGHAVVWVLADGPRLWRVDGDAAERVSGLPRTLFDTPAGESPSGMALAVHPTTDPAHQDVVAVGGHAFAFPAGRPQAALFTGKVAGAPGALAFPRAAVAYGLPPAEWVGAGVPAGVQELAWAPAGGTAHLWAAGSGGVFRSPADGARGSFRERNTGLAAADAVALAQAAGSDALLLLSTRDGGVLRQRAEETWEAVEAGAAGGVAVDPADPRRVYAQAGAGRWLQSGDGGRTFAGLGFQSGAPAGLPAADAARWAEALRDERDRSAAVGNMALLAVPGARGTQRALGTDRVWYADDALLRAAAASPRSGWITLPAATDPFDPARPDVPAHAQDRLDSAVLATCWGSADRLYVLTRGCVYLFERTSAGAWLPPQKLYDQAAVRRSRKSKLLPGQIPDDLPLTALAVHRASSGTGTLYAGTAGPDSAQHLWWFDGAGAWLPAGLTADTPVHAILADPASPDTVYVGTDAGVWRGTGTFPAGGAPSWTWVHDSASLPEAPCVDLAMYAPGGGAQRRLRAALAGRGVWEMAPGAPAQGPRVYLRSHPYDTRWTTVPEGGARDPLSPTGAQFPLDASPDLRVRRAPAAPPPRPVALPLTAASDPYDLWLMQSALRAAGEELDPEAPWSPAAAAARDRRRDALLTPAATPLQAWNAILAGHPLPFDRTPPDFADLAAHLRDEPDRWPKGSHTSSVADTAARVHVTVHSRHWHPVDFGRTSVALLRTPWSRRHSLAGTAPLPAGWAAALLADRTAPAASRGAWLAGSAWAYADPAAPFRPVDEPFDPHNPQVVEFDVSLAGASWEKPGWLLLAVVLADDDPLTATETDVARLVRTDYRVAARSVRRALVLAEPMTLYAGMDTSQYPGQAVMDNAWRASNLLWTGLYLDSPAPVPGEAATTRPRNGHNRLGGIGTHPLGGWMTAWPEIHSSWGILPIYWGQQDPANPNDGPVDVRLFVAEGNAVDAAAKATTAGIPAGAVLYVDWEVGGNPSVQGLAYCDQLFHLIAERGYRPGVYCHPPSSLQFRQNCPGLFVWNVNINPSNEARIRISGGQLLVRTPAMDARGERSTDRDALARQWSDTTPPPAGNPVPGFPGIDCNVAVVADPAFPERRCQPARIHGGRVAAVPAAAGACAIYAVRRGLPLRVTWAPGAAARDADPVPAGTPYAWNPFSTLAALGVPGPTAAPDPTHFLLALAFAEAEGEDAWRLQALRLPPGGAWAHQTVPGAGFAIDPLPGVAAVTRGDESVDTFVVDDDAGRLAVARWDPQARDWSPLTDIAGADVRRSNRHAAVSRAAGIADVFWVGADGLVRAASSAAGAPGTWSAPVQVGAPAVRVHPFANLAAVSRDADRVDVLFVGRQDGTTEWRLHDVFWTNPGGWGAPPHAQVAGGATVDLEPLAGIAACNRDADHVDAFVVGENGALFTTALTRATGAWSALRQIGGAPASRLASVDAACHHGPNDVQVVVTGRDGNVYATRWNAGTADYGPLERVGPLDL
jgi:hypothetical protein